MNKLNEGEKHLYDYYFGMSGSFYKALFDTITVADNDNLAKLQLAFPDEVGAYKSYSRVEGYWETLQVRYKTVGVA